MTTRERCMNILHYKDTDRIPAVHFGYWRELLAEWAAEGHITPEMAKAAREKAVSTYSEAAVAQRFIALYEDLLSPQSEVGE